MSMALPTAARSPKPHEPRPPEKRCQGDTGRVRLLTTGELAPDAIPATWQALPSTQGMGGKI
ncbi:hypothetical protein DDE82_000034 [Stemphylium lycopersici]|uniref:Uncharacterized protein n=1 Tax=Stemphylium lycopersici TaxID=183478 RepID=A0A364N969_STELY|nr:hypothetical protein DDE82_000034 [Stemphylium lycopersici]RAR13561.1 hypothetical protein DDE83_003018 [Stemphylium lycopersici]